MFFLLINFWKSELSLMCVQTKSQQTLVYFIKHKILDENTCEK